MLSEQNILYRNMPSNKDRLYVALYARGGSATMPDGEDKYVGDFPQFLPNDSVTFEDHPF